MKSLERWYLLFATLFFLVSSSVNLRAESGIWDVQKSDNPLLKKALSYDLDEGINPSGTPDQKRAEELYLQFIAENPNSPLVPFIYYWLGHTFSGKATLKHRESGAAVKDYVKARAYFKKAIEAYPEGKIGTDLIGAKVNVAALGPTKEEKVNGYIKCYQWLEDISSLKSEELQEVLWLTPYQKKLANYRENFISKAVQGLQREVKTVEKVTAINMVSAAWYSRESRIDLLKKIINAFPDKEPGKLAIEKLRQSGDIQVLKEIDIPSPGVQPLESNAKNKAEMELQTEKEPMETAKVETEKEGPEPALLTATGMPIVAYVLITVVVAIFVVTLALTLLLKKKASSRGKSCF